MPGPYTVAPIFLIRLAGVPFDAMTSLATPESIRLARILAACRLERSAARAALDRAYAAGERLVSHEASHALRVALRSNRAPAAVIGTQPAAVTEYSAAAKKVEASERELDLQLERDVNAARMTLIEWSRRFLPRYLVFATPGVRDSLLRSLNECPRDPAELPSRRNTSRKTEQSLMLYLQRIAAKNDTFSEFGPAGWGRSITDGAAISISPRPGAAAREVFFERWVAEAIAEVVSADPKAFAELIPRLNPNGRINNQTFVDLTTGTSAALSERELAVIKRCDGEISAHALDERIVRDLEAKRVLRCVLEPTALEPHTFELLIHEISRWRKGETRQKWLSKLQPLTDCQEKFGLAEPAERIELIDRAKAQVEQIGGARKSSQRFLYSASNPIGEECYRECGFEIRQNLLDEVANEAAPWIDLWRDSYAFIASRVAGGLRRVFEKAAGGREAMPMPMFLRACEEAKLPLTGPGLIALAVMAFQEVKAAMRERLAPHSHDEEYNLIPADCQVVRQKFTYPAFDEYTYPSADLQISAKSIEAVGQGQYDWIVSELHPPVALLHHGVYWSCPDKSLLNGAFVRSAGGKPNFHFGFFAADFTAHTAVRLFDALPELSFFVAAQRGNAQWQTVRPGDAEVFVDSQTGDVCLRQVGSQTYLGSFARNWVIPLGFHPFQFASGPHTPRLRCGRAIVQRQAWTITRQELPGDYTGISRDLVLGVEELRSRRNLPRYVYVRPTEQALRRSGAEGRDKDTKPIYIDFESYLFQEVFYRWLVKAGELEVTEMLPAPDQLLWKEADGRHTFELRTLIVPRS